MTLTIKSAIIDGEYVQAWYSADGVSGVICLPAIILNITPETDLKEVVEQYLKSQLI